MLAKAALAVLLFWLVMFGLTWLLTKKPVARARLITALMWGVPTGFFVILGVCVFVYSF